MPNARSPHSRVTMKVLALGNTGAGKTTQFLTLPGKKFIYLFDPNAILSLQGYDVDYEEFLATGMNLDVKSLSKDNKRVPVMRSTSAAMYEAWERDFEDRIRSGFFADYDWLGFDSFTTLSSMVMDEILRINNRPDTWPGQDDYGPQMLTLTNIVRQAAALPINIYFTGHIETRQDKVTKKVNTQPMMTGRLVQNLPLIFSEIFLLECTTGPTAVTYTLQTKPDSEFKTVRTSIKGLELFEDVTIDFSQPIVGQGLGGILNWADKQRKEAAA